MYAARVWDVLCVQLDAGPMGAGRGRDASGV